jgi:hypothetical protein
MARPSNGAAALKYEVPGDGSAWEGTAWPVGQFGPSGARPVKRMRDALQKGVGFTTAQCSLVRDVGVVKIRPAPGSRGSKKVWHLHMPNATEADADDVRDWHAALGAH